GDQCYAGQDAQSIIRLQITLAKTGSPVEEKYDESKKENSITSNKMIHLNAKTDISTWVKTGHLDFGLTTTYSNFLTSH
ncbi:MAG: hypothetical protein ABI210_11185, partial [Abditibacteriaceae bacterium]